MSEELKHCPFCKSSNIIEMGKKESSWCECNDCNATGPNGFKADPDVTWNTRAQHGVTDERFCAEDIGEPDSLPIDQWWRNNMPRQQGVTDEQAAIALRVWQAGNPDHGSINIMKDAIRAALHSDEDDKL